MAPRTVRRRTLLEVTSVDEEAGGVLFDVDGGEALDTE